MESFWKWLMRANAHAIFGGAVLGLVVVSSWWTWREFAPMEKIDGNPRTTQTERAQPGIGLVAFMDEQLTLRGGVLPANPFFDDVPKPKPITPKPNPGTTELPTAPRTALPQPRPKRDDNTGKPVKPQPPPAQKKDVVSLVYRGMLKGTDGKSVAMIEDSKDKKQRFYPVGQSIFGVTIGELGEKEAHITDASGADIALPFGQAVKFEDGAYAD